MKHLAEMVLDKSDKEAHKYIKRKLGMSASTQHLAHKINGFWFYLSRQQWAAYRKIGYNTLCGRQKSGKTNSEILGFKKIVKNTFKKGNSHGKDYMRSINYDNKN